MEHHQRKRKAPNRFMEHTNEEALKKNLLIESKAKQKVEGIKNGVSLASVTEANTKRLPYNSKVRLQCEKCEELFCNQNAFQKHEQNHKNNTSTKHIQETTEQSTKEQRKLYFSCMECQKEFRNHYAVRRHYKQVHIAARNYECLECDAKFKNKPTYLYHLATHSGEKPFECSEYGKRFILKYELKLHMRTHTLEKPHRCEECQKTFTHRSNLVVHQRLHTNLRPFHCPTCNSCFNSNSHLKKHQAMHLKKTEPKIVQKITIENVVKIENYRTINETRKSPKLLSIHNFTSQSKTIHHSILDENLGNSMPLTDIVQNASLLANCQSFLKRNKKRENIHVETAKSVSSTLKPNEQWPERPQIIDVEILPNFNTDQNGVNVSGTAPFLLSTSCKPIFDQKLYKFQCDNCFKYFKQKSALSKHMRTHSGEKPYKCPICPKSFVDPSNFKKHKLLHKNATDELKNITSQYSAATLLEQKYNVSSPAHSSTASDPDPDGLEISLQRLPSNCECDNDTSSSASSVDEDRVWHVDANVLLPLLNIRKNTLRNDDINDDNANITKIDNLNVVNKIINKQKKIVRVSYKDTQNPEEEKRTTYYIIK